MRSHPHCRSKPSCHRHEGDTPDRAAVLKRRAERPAGGHVPEAGGPVAAGGGHHAAVGTEGDLFDRPAVLKRRTQRQTGVRIPRPRRAVQAGGQDRAPSGLKATALISSVCVRIGNSKSPVSLFHTRAVPSTEPVATCLPSGLKAAASTNASCSRVGPVGRRSSHPRAGPPFAGPR